MKSGLVGILLLTAIAPAPAAPAAPAMPEPAMTIPLCATCLNPSLSSIGGQGSHFARLTAHIVRADIERWCAQYQPGNPACPVTMQSRRENFVDFVARADCPAGIITTMDRAEFSIATAPDGRRVWRDQSGRIAGQGGHGDPPIIDTQWELLCPTGAPGPGRMPNGGAMRAHFALGQLVEVQHDRLWWPGMIMSVRMKRRQTGSEMLYEIRYENGGRAFFPEWRIRARFPRPTPRED